MFCSRKDEARQLAEMFNDRGIPSAYLSGDHNFDKREKEIKRLDTERFIISSQLIFLMKVLISLK